MLHLLILFSAVSSANADCPDGYVYNSNFDRCYRFVTAPSDALTYLEAQYDCTKDGANLVTIRNAFENNWIYQQLSSTKSHFYIGYSRLFDEENAYDWADHSDTTYNNWASNAASRLDSAYVDMACSGCWKTAAGMLASKHYICGKLNEIVTTEPPCTVRQREPYCESGWSLFSTFCYRVIDTANFTKAIPTCQQNGGILASIHSQEENAFVSQLTSWSETDGLYIGLIRFLDMWMWLDGTAIDYHNMPLGHSDQGSPSSFWQLDRGSLTWKSTSGTPASASISSVCKKQALRQ